MRKLTKGTETANIMVGEVEDLHATICGFMRLNDAQVIDDLSEVELPSRFIIYILGPQGSSVFLKEMGRCMATMMVDDVSEDSNVNLNICCFVCLCYICCVDCLCCFCCVG